MTLGVVVAVAVAGRKDALLGRAQMGWEPAGAVGVSVQWEEGVVLFPLVVAFETLRELLTGPWTYPE